VEVGARFFENLFRAPTGCPIQETLEVITKFPSFFTKEMNEEVIRDATE